MKIYFAGSIRGGRKDSEIYFEIVKILSKFGAVLTEHVADKNLSSYGEGKDDKYIHDRDLRWIDECDVFVAEITTPSLGVGYEIRDSELKNKPTLCIYRQADDSKVSAMIAGSDTIVAESYKDIADLENIFEEFLKNYVKK